MAHIDGDEVLSVDTTVLDGLGEQDSVLRFEVLEIATDGTPTGDEEPLWFKRRLSADKLALLESLGIIRHAANRAYFRGHLNGKSAVRPTARGWLSCHDVLDLAGERMPEIADPALRVLHFESADLDEFERKRRALLESRVPPALRPSREKISAALQGLFSLDLPAAVHQRYLREVFEEHRADDVSRLRELGLLTAHHWQSPREHRGLSAPQVADLAAVLRPLPRLGVAWFARREEVLKIG